MRHRSWLHISEWRTRVCKAYYANNNKKTSLTMRHRSWLRIHEWRARVCKLYKIIKKNKFEHASSNVEAYQ